MRLQFLNRVNRLEYYPSAMIGPWVAVGSPLLVANINAINLTIKFLSEKTPRTVTPLRYAMTSGTPDPTAGGCTN